METAKNHFDRLMSDEYPVVAYYTGVRFIGDFEGINDNRFAILAECLTSDCRHNRTYTTLLQDTDGKYYRTEYGYEVGGDAEYKGFYGSIVPINDGDAAVFLKWSKLVNSINGVINDND